MNPTLFISHGAPNIILSDIKSKQNIKKLADEIQVIEQAANERLLATISTSQVGQFTIESALERKYKLKLEVVSTNFGTKSK